MRENGYYKVVFKWRPQVKWEIALYAFGGWVVFGKGDIYTDTDFSVIGEKIEL